MVYVTRLARLARFARLTIVEDKNKSRFDFKLVLKRKNNIYIKENTNRAFLLEHLVSKIRLLLPHGATETPQLRPVCNTFITSNSFKTKY